MRLSLAGLRQIFQPRYTAETILGLKGAESLFFVRELGFANVSIGCIGLVSLFAPAWGHKLQNVALVSDLFAALALATCCFA